MTKRLQIEDKEKLRKITDEIFLLSSKPQLPLVQKMKRIDCSVMDGGLRKFNMDYFYCKNCDKEHKFPICLKCKDECHKGHIFSDYVKASDDHLAICMCGFKAHNMRKKEKEMDLEQNSIKCCFNQLSRAAEVYEYYQGFNDKKVCLFCYHFCCHSLLTDNENDQERELEKYQFKRIKVSKEEFELGIQRKEITCDCLTLIDSKHKSADYLSVFINDLNIPSKEEDDEYFSHLTPTQIINIFFNSTELFENIYSGFISEHNEMTHILSNDVKLDKNFISTSFTIGYANFANNAQNCRQNFYFSEKISIFFTTKFTKSILDKNLKYTEQNITFLFSYLQGYLKFRLGGYFEQLPRYLLTDIINMSPFQRKTYREKSNQILISSGLYKEKLFESLLTSIERLIRLRLDLEESLPLFAQYFTFVKFYARFFLITKEELTKTCKILDDLFNYLSRYKTVPLQNQSASLKNKMKLIKTIVKIITYFTASINDETFFAFFKNDVSETETIFFHSFTEQSKLIAKITVHTSDYLREEYEKASMLLIQEQNRKEDFFENKYNIKEHEESSIEEYKEYLVTMININQIPINLALYEKDSYLPSLKRTINHNLEFNIKSDTIESSNSPIMKLITEETNSLERLYKDYCCCQKVKMEIIQDYALFSVSKVNEKLEYRYEDLIAKKNDYIITCVYEYKYKVKADANHNLKKKKAINQLQLGKTNFLYTFTKIFNLTKNKSVFKKELCDQLITFCFSFIHDNQDNCIIGLSTPILNNLSRLPRNYMGCAMDYLIFGLKIMIKYNCEIPFTFLFAKYGYLYFHKTTNKSKQNNKETLPNSPLILKKLWKLILLVFQVKSNDTSHFLDFIKPMLEVLAHHELVWNYKMYLLDIANDFSRNGRPYIERRRFDSKEIFNNHFDSIINQSQGILDEHFEFKIFLGYISILNKTYDVNALDSLPPFLKEFLTPQEIISILSITTLYIPLRIELIKYFRMVYIDLPISLNSMDKYRYIFQKDLEGDMNEIKDSLIPIEQMKIFLFLQRLMSVGNYNFISDESLGEYELLFFEIKNIIDIITHSKEVSTDIYLSYIENGILLPIKIFLNKIFSMIMTIKGPGMIKLYRFCYYVLKLKQFIIESKLLSNVNSNTERVFNNRLLTHRDSLNEVLIDLDKITNKEFTILNYLEIYKIITKHVMSLIDNPTSHELVLYFSEYEQFEESIKQYFKSELESKGIDFKNRIYNSAWKAYESYIDQKVNFEKSSLKANFDENFLDEEATIHSVLIKYLLFLSTNNITSLAQQGNNMLLKNLKNDTNKSQEAIYAIAEKIGKNNNKKSSHGNEKENFDKNKQIEDFITLAKSGFNSILSIIFAQYNPTSLELSDDYYTACHIIKLFKFLCEDHNQYFQKRLMCEMSFEISGNQKIYFYDMMLFVLDKIITISNWETSKTEEDVQDYFYGIFSCIIEMLIEIIQGSHPHNFFVLYKSWKENINIKPQQNDNHYDAGKALRTFLAHIKGLMFDDVSESETIFSIRKYLMAFLLAFMEEYNCPMQIKNMIMSYYHPSMLIKSISNVLKRYYLSQVNISKNKSVEKSFKRKRTHRIIDQNFMITQQELRAQPHEKKLKQLKFNSVLCEKFTQLYFEDPTFSETKAFDLCNVFYNFFILTYIQYQNEETIDFWNKIHSQTPDTLDVFNKRTKISNDQETVFSPVTDDSDLEAFYVIKFFQEVSRHVLVKIKPDAPPIYVIYTIHPFSRYLSSDSKAEFLRNVDRKNRYTKLYDLMESSEYFQLEIIFNWNNLRRSSLLRKSTDLNYHFIGYILFLISLCLNIVLLSTLHESGEEADGNNTLAIVRILSFVCCGIALIIVIFWFLTKLKLYYVIEKAKYKEHNKEKKGLDDSQLTVIDNIIIRINAIVGKGELTPFFFFIIFTFLGSITKNLQFFFSFALLSVVSLSKSLNNIALSIVLKGRQLMWTSVFTLVLLYVYAGWGFYYQRDRFYEREGREVPDHMCQSLLYCFLTHINNGLRWHAGIGKIVMSESGIIHVGAFIHRFFYDWAFFWLLEAVMLHIVFGIILNSFGELRQAHYLIEQDLANNCFICDTVKDECEKNNKSFKEHCEKEHNIWDYAFYMITLRMKNPQELNSINSQCRDMILEKDIGWLPDTSYEHTNHQEEDFANLSEMDKDNNDKEDDEDENEIDSISIQEFDDENEDGENDNKTEQSKA